MAGRGGGGKGAGANFSDSRGSQWPGLAEGLSPDLTTLLAPQKQRKYRNVKTIVDGVTFDSKREAERYGQLRMLEQAGVIHDLEAHPKYRLEVNGRLIGTYRPDFRYRVVETDEITVEDVKSKPTITEAYRLRKKLMLALYNVIVVEVLP